MAPLCAQLNTDRSLAVMLSLFVKPSLSLDSQVEIIRGDRPVRSEEKALEISSISPQRGSA